MTISLRAFHLLALAMFSFSSVSSAMNLSIFRNLLKYPLKIGIANTDIELGEIPLECGEIAINAVYKLSADQTKKMPNKWALLLNGSPGTQFFTDEGANFKAVADGLREKGYQIIEIAYPHKASKDDESEARGFYSACYRQGLDNVQKHAADLYDAITHKINYDPQNPDHEFVAFGFSLGAIEIQSMAFGYGKKFDRIGLSGVLLGDAVQGCRVGLEYLEKESSLIDDEVDMCSEPRFTAGLGWHSFMDLAQFLTVSGNGCCIEGSSSYGGCREGEKSEFTTKLNFENQPFYTISTVSIFEGTKACSKLSLDEFAGANPAQVKYIVEKRQAAGAPTKAFFYDNCSHSVLECVDNNNSVVKDILDALAPSN